MDMNSLKAQNLLKIISLLRNHPDITRQELAREAGISMPTALHMIEELSRKNLITETGENASTGGRRAKTFSLNPESGYGVGIQIARKYVEFVLVNLRGEVKEKVRYETSFSDQPAWYRKLGAKLIDLISQADVEEEKVIGVGISFPGIIDLENSLILHSHVFSLQNVSLDRFYKCISYPLVIVNDANCACYAEQSQREEDFLYISLNESVGGAVIVDHTLYTGKHWQAGEVGHVVLYPKGKSCYCGKEGCSDAYLSAGVLCEGHEDLDDFFAHLEKKDPRAIQIWDTYLNDLAILVSNMRMLLDMDIVVGGDVGARMDAYVEDLAERIEEYDLFSRNVDYVRACRCKENIFSVGAALSAIDHFEYRLL